MELPPIQGSFERMARSESVRPPGELRYDGASGENASTMEPASPADSADTAYFSPEALARSRAGLDPAREDEGAATDGDESGKAGRENELTPEEQQQIDKLRARDAEVRAHEAAHMAAGGSLVRGGASYSYQVGPDGKQYAVGGEVSIDVSTVAGNPQATIQRMQQVRAAALAPAEPSGADLGVAARAAQIEAEARQQLAERALERVGTAYSEKQTQAAGGLVDARA